MTEKRDGGPAFPKHTVELPSGELQWGAGGMTLRDWFAGQALVAIAQQSVVTHAQHAKQAGVSAEAIVAGKCYAQADAMLKARDV